MRKSRISQKTTPRPEQKKKTKVVVTETTQPKFTPPTIAAEKPVKPVVTVVRPVADKPDKPVAKPDPKPKKLPYFNFIRIPIGAINSNDALPEFTTGNEKYETLLSIALGKGYELLPGNTLYIGGSLLLILTRK